MDNVYRSHNYDDSAYSSSASQNPESFSYQRQDFDNMSHISGERIPPFRPESSMSMQSSVSQVPKPKVSENTRKFFGLGIGLGSVFAENVLCHPCVVLRRQCQVHHNSKWFHLTPITLTQIIFNIQRNQSVTTLWKGIGSTFIVKGITVASEAAMSEILPLSKEVNRHSTLKKIFGHLLLKSLSHVITTPFYASSFVETVQSEIANEGPGVFDCLREGLARLAGWTSQTNRLIPVWKLMPIVGLYGLLHYIVSSLAKYTVDSSMKTEIEEKKLSRQLSRQQYASSPTYSTFSMKQEQHILEQSEQSLYETYYPELISTYTGNLLADIMLYPLENCMNRLFLQGTRTIIDNTDTGFGVIPIITTYEGPIDCISMILQTEGPFGFYKGFGSLLLQYGLHMAILKCTRLLLEQFSKDFRKTSLDADYPSNLPNYPRNTPLPHMYSRSGTPFQPIPCRPASTCRPSSTTGRPSSSLDMQDKSNNYNQNVPNSAFKRIYSMPPKSPMGRFTNGDNDSDSYELREDIAMPQQIPARSPNRPYSPAKSSYSSSSRSSGMNPLPDHLRL